MVCKGHRILLCFFFPCPGFPGGPGAPLGLGVSAVGTLSVGLAPEDGIAPSDDVTGETFDPVDRLDSSMPAFVVCERSSAPSVAVLPLSAVPIGSLPRKPPTACGLEPPGT
jgi:hypothetical protein